jgi:Asp-tRNA(Asn)/Glu-tRNA(Gln) amidotransferase A subunit family amidase
MQRSGEAAAEVARRVRARGQSAAEVMGACLAAIDERDGALGAFTEVHRDEATAAAAAIDRRLARGEPVAVKDHLWMEGRRATNGSRLLRDFVAPADAVPVARLRAAGAVIVGRTNVPEFCYAGHCHNELWGVTRNPHDVSRTPGGSSGGTAAAIAAGMVPLGLGTDSGGSIRLPASFCGIAGLKPTFGIVPREPGFRGSRTLSATGPMAATAADAALLLSVLAGPSALDDLSRAAAPERPWPDSLRIAWSEDCGFARVDAPVRAAFRSAVMRLAAAGIAVEEAHPDAPDPTELWTRIALPEAFASEGALLDGAAEMTPGTAALILSGDRAASEYLDALYARAGYARPWLEFLEHWDVLLTPAAQTVPFAAEDDGPRAVEGVAVEPPWGDWCSLSYPANLTGQPAAVIRCGIDPDGLPVGMQLTARRFGDRHLLETAAALERVLAA